MRRMRLDVYDVTNSSLIGTLSEPDPSDDEKPSTHSRLMLPDLLGPGRLTFTTDLAVTDDVDLLDYRRIVRVLVDEGDGWHTTETFVIADMPRQLVADGPGPAVQVECQGLLSWLGYDRGGAVLHPYKSVYGLQLRPRVFGWFAFDYDPETPPWATPDSLGTYANPTDPELKGGEGDPGVNEVQRVTIASEPPPWPWGSSYPSPGGLTGTWRVVTPQGVTTGPLQWDATNAQFKSALEAAGESIGSVTGTYTAADPFVVTWDDETGHALMKVIHDDLRHDHGVTGVKRITAGSQSVDGEELIDGWPDANSVWYGHFGIDNHYRFLFQPNATQTGPVTIYAVTAGTSLQLWIDGAPSGTAGPLQVLRASNDLEETDHMIAVHADGPMMVTIIRGEDVVLFRTGSAGWIVHEGVPPGVTPGFAADRALSESQGRGLIPYLDWDFLVDKDSGNVDWGRRFVHGFRLQLLGRFLEDLAEIAGPVEPRMTPTGTLQLWQRRGTNRTATVTLQLPFGASASGQGPRLTRGLIETPDGLAEAGPIAEAEWGPMEDLVTFGTGLEPDLLIPTVQDLLAKYSDVRDEVDLELPDDVNPYVDVFLGDSVAVDVGDVDGTYRLTTFALADGESQPEWSATGIPWSEA